MSIVGSVAVRVVPSFTGLHKTIGRTFSNAGAEAGKTFSGSMGANLQNMGGAIQGVGDKIAGIGGKLTKGITVPVAGATAAVGGLVGALGFQRLVGVDTARAKLQGLGYDIEDVERISGMVTDAIDGTMITMAEGVNIAVGALASGVEEGEELERYIRLVGDAANFAGVPIENMAEIFNRVQGSGKLMLNELNMLERQVPGSTAKLAESYGVSQEAFREMVSAGEVDAAHFIDVMDDFLGGAGEAYADSFAGLAKNTLAYVGIIGESILSGAFQEAKGELASFVDFLSSPAVQEWAQDIGVRVGEIFSKIVESVKTAIDWWINLDGETQRLILSIAGIAVAAGPVLMIVGKLTSFFGRFMGIIGGVVGWLSRLITPLFASTSQLRLLPRILVVGSRAFSALTGPIGIIIGLLVGVWAASESFRDSVMNLGRAIWDSLVDAFNHILPYVQDLWGSLTDLWGSLSQGGGILDMVGNVLAWVVDLFAWLLPIVIEFAGVIIGKLIGALDWLVGAITSVSDWLAGLGDATTTQGSIMASTWEWIQAAISVVVTWIMDVAVPWIISAWETITAGAQWLGEMIATVWDGIVTGVTWLWDTLEFIFILVAAIFLWLGETMYEQVYMRFIHPMLTRFAETMVWLWEGVLQPVIGFIATAWGWMSDALRWAWENIIRPMVEAAVAGFLWLWDEILRPIFNWIADLWVSMARTLRDFWRDTIRPMIEAFGDWVSNLYYTYISPVLGWIVDKWDGLKNSLVGFWENSIKPMLEEFGKFFTETLPGWVGSGVDFIRDAWFKVANFFREPINWVIETVWNDGIRAAFNRVADAVGSDATLRRMSTIGFFGAAGAGSRGNIPGYAKGGVMGSGLKWVGEEGPELIATGPGWVATATESKKLLGIGGGDSDRDRREAERSPSLWDRLKVGLPGQGRSAWESTQDAGKFIIGQLADAADAMLKPFLRSARNYMSPRFGLMADLGIGFVEDSISKVVEWAKGHDETAFGDYGGAFVGNPGGFNRPAQGVISSWAGARGFQGRFGGMHYGVDIANAVGTTIRAAWDGVVRKIYGGGMDKRMVLSHGAFDTSYLHNSAHLVGLGAKVKGGQPIARMGSAGTGPHLHFELHPGGWYNPSISGVNALFGRGGGGGAGAVLRDKGGLMYPGIGLYNNQTGGPEYISNQRQFDNLNKMAARVASGEAGPGMIVNQYGLDHNNARANVNEFMRAKRRLDRGGKHPAGVG